MSNESGNSSGTSVARVRGRVVGVPKRCWCGELVVSLMSKSAANPYRRYYRCAFAVERKLSNDNHTYKWVDEAFVDEIEALTCRISRLEDTILAESVEEGRKKLAELEMKLETEVFARVEEVVNEVKWEVKKMMGIVLLGTLTMLVLSKLV
ncbi:hypothetical protein BRARA_K01450 [Brassica rapa]|uniref:GRF-type domain-containing protein n=1 Tax=Brassica campestris TaxID=3711 RepID=A0A397L112_BRACM|nr:uncharacterized protein At4g04775-like [Brassica rapa]XP_022548821.1 uncharacterized protein At4g04775-like [Brassica napus]RIA04327.1 hypothetical protein BRARA_K01450 [Brassica rapa]